LKGVTFIVSSGDDGAFSSLVRNTTDNCYYTASFPASTLYVTAVGATFGPESGAPEQGCDSARGGFITSGGGFAFNTNRPTWQNNAINQYLMQHPFRQDAINAYNLDPTPPHKLYFNYNGRGVPDISLLGFNYDIIIGGENVPVSGTSASAPAFAAMVSLVNAGRLAAGKGPIGYLNNILYTYASRFTNDITIGDSSCVGGSGDLPNCCARRGWSAAPGWDPVTGLGSIDFKKFYEFMVNVEASGKLMR
jgi:tripeptidyl-peptidase-1